MQKELGTHLVVDAWQCPAEVLNDPELIRRAMIEAIVAGSATLIDLCVHQFSPHGVTATATLAESHIAIHTWPELGYFAADLFFCGSGEPRKAIQVLQEALQAKQVTLRELKRGFSPVAAMDSFDHVDLLINDSADALRNDRTSPMSENLISKLEACLVNS